MQKMSHGAGEPEAARRGYMRLPRNFLTIALGALLVGACGDGSGTEEPRSEGPLQGRIVSQEWVNFGDFPKLSVVLELVNTATVPVEVVFWPNLVAEDDSHIVQMLLGWEDGTWGYSQPEDYLVLEPGGVSTVSLSAGGVGLYSLAVGPAPAPSLYIHLPQLQERIPVAPLPALEELDIAEWLDEETLASMLRDPPPRAGASGGSSGRAVTGCTCTTYLNGVPVYTRTIPPGASCDGKICQP